MNGCVAKANRMLELAKVLTGHVAGDGTCI
jgi:hypothetical protein